MILGGYQKLSLIDFPGKVATIVFTKGCLFRCPFCHNPELVESLNGDALDEKEWWDHLESRRGFIDGVVITGGEPTLHKDLPDFIRRIKSMGYAVKLDTNGITPDMVSDLINERLVDYFAMDLKDTWPNYQRIANLPKGKEGLVENCRRSFDLIRNSGIAYEWRTTVLPGVHTEDDLVAVAENLIPGERYYLQDINYAVTLRKLDPTKHLDVNGVAKRIRVRYPELLVDVR